MLREDLIRLSEKWRNTGYENCAAELYAMLDFHEPKENINIFYGQIIASCCLVAMSALEEREPSSGAWNVQICVVRDALVKLINEFSS